MGQSSERCFGGENEPKDPARSDRTTTGCHKSCAEDMLRSQGSLIRRCPCLRARSSLVDPQARRRQRTAAPNSMGDPPHTASPPDIRSIPMVCLETLLKGGTLTTKDVTLPGCPQCRRSQPVTRSHRGVRDATRRGWGPAGGRGQQGQIGDPATASQEPSMPERVALPLLGHEPRLCHGAPRIAQTADRRSGAGRVTDIAGGCVLSVLANTPRRLPAMPWAARGRAVILIPPAENLGRHSAFPRTAGSWWFRHQNRQDPAVLQGSRDCQGCTGGHKSREIGASACWGADLLSPGPAAHCFALYKAASA
jgi:hypothetical protein